MWLRASINCGACRLSYSDWVYLPDDISVVVKGSKCPICGHDNSDTYMLDPDWGDHSPNLN